MKAYLTFTWLETKLYLRAFYSPFFAIAFPVMLLLLFGSVYGNTPDEFFGGFGAADVSTAAFMGIVIVVNGLMNLPLALAGYRDRKILKRFRATPVSPAVLLTSQITVNVVMTVVGLAVLVAVGMLVFGAELYGSVWSVAAAVALTMASMFSMGLIVASLAPTEKASNIVANLLYFPMVFLSGATLPYQLFPEGLQKVTKILPLTHGVALIKGVWTGRSLGGFPTELWVLGATTIAFALLGAVMFRWE